MYFNLLLSLFIVIFLWGWKHLWEICGFHGTAWVLRAVGTAENPGGEGYVVGIIYPLIEKGLT